VSSLDPLFSIFLERLVVDQVVKKFPAVVGPKSSLPCAQNPAIRYFPKPAESLHTPTFFSSKIHFNMIFLLRLDLQGSNFSSSFVTKTMREYLSYPYVLRVLPISFFSS
jgi:hypothetical protein